MDDHTVGLSTITMNPSTEGHATEVGYIVTPLSRCSFVRSKRLALSGALAASSEGPITLEGQTPHMTVENNNVVGSDSEWVIEWEPSISIN